MEQYDHWAWRLDDKGALWVQFDRAGRSSNSINLEVLLELEHLMDYFYQNYKNNPDWKKIIFCSKKMSGFIAGADILEVFSQKDAGKTDALIEKGQALFLKIEKFPLPTIALIHGFCLGGGFELALACDWRIALDSPSLVMGLPEVLLGLQPGWGGSIRLPRLIGVQNAFNLILSGKTLKAPQIKKLKLADYVIPERLVASTIDACDKKRVRSWWRTAFPWILPPARWLMAIMMRRSLAAQKINKAHYPAPFAIIDGWSQHGHLSSAAFHWEVASIQSLSRTETAAHLMNVFRLKDQSKKGLDKKNLTIKKVHVIGAGVMGGDIAFCSAAQGYQVTLADTDLSKIQSTLKRAQSWADKNLKKEQEKTAFFDRLIPDPSGLGVASADLIIEAVPEIIDLKKKILSSVESQARIDAIIASNTSTLPIDDLATGLKNPDRLIGIHFFNPVPKMPLVEVISGKKTTRHVYQQAISWVGSIKKIPLAVKSVPGFFVNRILLPYITQAFELYHKGISKEIIDLSAVEFGMPMGPLELADQVGLDVCLAALKSMGLALPQTLHDSLEHLVAKNELGKKTGRGIYSYKNGQAIRSSIQDRSQKQYCQDRLIFALLNEVVQAAHQKIVSSQDEADLACLFGFGFPAFRGGPFVYIKEQGVRHLLQRFEACFADRIDWAEQEKAWLQLEY